jgi:hypothetical protein
MSLPCQGVIFSYYYKKLYEKKQCWNGNALLRASGCPDAPLSWVATIQMAHCIASTTPLQKFIKKIHSPRSDLHSKDMTSTCPCHRGFQRGPRRPLRCARPHAWRHPSSAPDLPSPLLLLRRLPHLTVQALSRPHVGTASLVMSWPPKVAACMLEPNDADTSPAQGEAPGLGAEALQPHPPTTAVVP